MSRDKMMAMAGMLVVGVFMSLLTLMAPQTASAAYETFICIDGIRGEILKGPCPDAIDVVSWSFGVASPVDPARSGSAGAGKVIVTPDFKFVTRTSKASPVLFQYATTGKHPKSAVLIVRKPGGSGPSAADFLKITLSEVVVSSFLNLGNSKSAEPYPMEEITLKFNKIEITYTEFGSDGSRKAAVIANWELQQTK